MADERIIPELVAEPTEPSAAGEYLYDLLAAHDKAMMEKKRDGTDKD